jgi:hypothetical protein
MGNSDNNNGWAFTWDSDLFALPNGLKNEDWHHITLTWDGDRVTSYLNGTKVDHKIWTHSADNSTSITSILTDFGNDLYIGRTYNDAGKMMVTWIL